MSPEAGDRRTRTGARVTSGGRRWEGQAGWAEQCFTSRPLQPSRKSGRHPGWGGRKDGGGRAGRLLGAGRESRGGGGAGRGENLMEGNRWDDRAVGREEGLGRPKR